MATFSAIYNQLQTDMNKMYNWSVTNNMLFNASKFQSISYSSHASVDSNFIDWLVLHLKVGSIAVFSC